MQEMLIESARKGKKRVGQIYLIKHLQGKRLTIRQAIKAKCYDCNGMGEGSGCDNTECSLYPYSPNRIATAINLKGQPTVEMAL